MECDLKMARQETFTNTYYDFDDYKYVPPVTN
jgi:hypothetical protein